MENTKLFFSTVPIFASNASVSDSNSVKTPVQVHLLLLHLHLLLCSIIYALNDWVLERGSSKRTRWQTAGLSNMHCASEQSWEVT